MNTTGKFLRGDEALALIHEIGRLDQAHFPRPWSDEDWNHLDEEHHLIYAWQNSFVEGMALFHRVKNDETAHLLKICLIPELRGKGLSLTFWQHILKDLKANSVVSVFLEVEKGNVQAQKFYLKQGFKILREVRGYYSDGAAGIMMNMTL